MPTSDPHHHHDRAAHAPEKLPGITHVIAVGSGKGGVENPPSP